MELWFDRKYKIADNRNLNCNQKGNLIMDNNKNRMKDREKSNADLRKMDPKDNADVGMINGQAIGVHERKHEKSRSNQKGERR